MDAGARVEFLTFVVELSSVIRVSTFASRIRLGTEDWQLRKRRQTFFSSLLVLVFAA